MSQKHVACNVNLLPTPQDPGSNLKVSKAKGAWGKEIFEVFPSDQRKATWPGIVVDLPHGHFLGSSGHQDFTEPDTGEEP